MDYFHHLSLDLLYEIVIKLNGNGIVNLCQTNKNLFDKICNEKIKNNMKNKEDDFGFKLIEKYIYSKYTIYHPFGLFSNKLGIDTNEDEKKYINDFFDSNIKKILFDFIITLFFNRFYIEDNVGNFRNFRNLSPDERIYIRSFLGNEDNIFGKLIQEEYFDSLLEKGEFTNLDDHIHVFLANNYI